MSWFTPDVAIGIAIFVGLAATANYFWPRSAPPSGERDAGPQPPETT